MKIFRFVILVVLLVGSGVATYVRQSKFKEISFHGELIDRDRVLGGSSTDPAIAILIEAEDGSQVKWTTSESIANWYHKGDYLVKPSGKKYPAVFRNGKQIRGTSVPYYLDEDIDLEFYRGQNAAPLPTAPEEEAHPPTQAELPPTSAAEPFGPGPGAAAAPQAQPPAAAAPAAPPAGGTEQDAARLLGEAAQLWERRDFQGSIEKSEQALKIRIALYGENHYLVVDVRRRISLAQQRMASQ